MTEFGSFLFWCSIVLIISTLTICRWEANASPEEYNISENPGMALFIASELGSFALLDLGIAYECWVRGQEKACLRLVIVAFLLLAATYKHIRTLESLPETSNKGE